ncbi:MAG: VWA domain-containing protein [bacterium]|nr:VWA domain-containing protein [bacterium]
MIIDFLRPTAFILAPSIIVLALLHLRGGKGNLSSLLLRLLSISLLIIALAEPVSKEQKQEQHSLVIADVSKSITDNALDSYASAILKTPDLLRNGSELRAFAADVNHETLRLSKSTSSDSIVNFLSASRDRVNTGATNLEAGIVESLAASTGRAIVVLSDGQENQGNALQAARIAGRQDIAISPMALPADVFAKKEMRITRLEAPLVLEQEKSTDINVSLFSNHDEQHSASFSLLLDEKLLNQMNVVLVPDSEKLLTLPSGKLVGGLHKLTARLKDENGEATERHQWITVKEPDKILILSGEANDNRVVTQLFSQLGYTLEVVTGPELQNFKDALEKFPYVVLNNASSKQLPAGMLDKLKTYVAGGGNLLLTGGERAFGLGGYKGTQLEDISPVTFVPPQTAKKRLNNAVVLVLDKSRSMLHQRQIDSAKRAALESIDALKNDDMISVIGFDTAPFVVIKLDTIANIRPIAERRLRNLTAAGGTNLLPALQQARNFLQAADAGRKHIIVLSDGKVPNAGRVYLDEVETLRRSGITLSAVALGAEADVPFMKIISENGRGAFYHTLEPTMLPRIFLQDIKVSTGEKTLNESGHIKVFRGADFGKSTKVATYPELLGFVETQAKQSAQLELAVDSNGKAFPLLASWKYKAGNVVVFTSDIKARWSQRWIKWNQLGQFWYEIMKSMKSISNSGNGNFDFDFNSKVSGKNLFLEIIVYDESLRSGSSSTTFSALIDGPAELKKNLRFEQNTPGVFQATLEDIIPGDYRINASYNSAKLPQLGVSVSAEQLGETTGRGINQALLAEIARLSGGRITYPGQEFKGKVSKLSNTTWLAGYFAIAAILLLILEAFVREVLYRPGKIR